MRITYHSIVRERESGEEIDIHRERGGGGLVVMNCWGWRPWRFGLPFSSFIFSPLKEERGRRQSRTACSLCIFLATFLSFSPEYISVATSSENEIYFLLTPAAVL